MLVKRATLALGVAVLGLAASAPASAQFFFKSKDFSGQPVKGDEPDLGQPLPGATDAELRAAMAWNLRAALNVAALQCQFEPTLLTVDTYNAILKDHETELGGSVKTLQKYFVRTAKTAKQGQTDFDHFGTALYSGYATVAAQYNFCQTAHTIGQDALFTPRGQFGDLARNRVRELRNSLKPYGEQQFSRYLPHDPANTPRLDAICWNKKGEWVEKKCGPLTWPAAGNAIAAR